MVAYAASKFANGERAIRDGRGMGESKKACRRLRCTRRLIVGMMVVAAGNLATLDSVNAAVGDPPGPEPESTSSVPLAGDAVAVDPDISFAPAGGTLVTEPVTVSAVCGPGPGTLTVYLRRVDPRSEILATDEIPLDADGRASHVLDLAAMSPGTYGVLSACSPSAVDASPSTIAMQAGYFAVGSSDAVVNGPSVAWAYDDAVRATSVLVETTQCLPIGPGSAVLSIFWSDDGPFQSLAADEAGNAMAARSLDGGLDVGAFCVEELGGARGVLASTKTGQIPNAMTPGFETVFVDPGPAHGEAVVLGEGQQRSAGTPIVQEESSPFAPIPRRAGPRLARTGFEPGLLAVGLGLVAGGLALTAVARRRAGARQ